MTKQEQIKEWLSVANHIEKHWNEAGEAEKIRAWVRDGAEGLHPNGLESSVYDCFSINNGLNIGRLD